MSKRKRPKEEFLADLRPLKKRLTWKEAINRVFKEYPIGYLMGKDQIKNEFLSIHKIDKLKIETSHERIEEQFEKKLKEFTDEDILFENQEVHTINPQLTTTTIPFSGTNEILRNEGEETNEIKMYSDLEKIEKEINETDSHDDGDDEDEISEEEDSDEEGISMKEAVQIVLNELKEDEAFISSSIRIELKNKIEKKEIILDTELKRKCLSYLTELFLSNWKTDSGWKIFRRKITEKEKQKYSANKQTQNIYWLGKPEEEEEDINIPIYKSSEEEIEEILKENGRMMSTNQIFNLSQHSLDSTLKRLLQLIKHYSTRTFGVKRIELNKEMKKRWKRKYKVRSSPTFLYYYQEEGSEEQKFDLEDGDFTPFNK